jgi:hypothetical protein
MMMISSVVVSMLPPVVNSYQNWDCKFSVRASRAVCNSETKPLHGVLAERTFRHMAVVSPWRPHCTVCVRMPTNGRLRVVVPNGRNGEQSMRSG